MIHIINRLLPSHKAYMDLLEGCIEGDAKAVRTNTPLCDINKVYRKTQTPLIAAARRGRTGIIKSLINSGADPNIHAGKTTAIIEAIQAGNVETVELLLSLGANQNLGTHQGNNSIALATEINDLEILNTLLENDSSNIDKINNRGEYAAFIAAKKQEKESLAYLIEAGANCNIRCPKTNTSAVTEAIKSGLIDLIKQEHITQELINCTLESNPIFIKALLEAGAEQERAFEIAIEINSKKTLAKYKDFQARTQDSFGRTPFIAAIKRDDEKSADNFLSRAKTTDKDHTGSYAIHYAVAMSNCNILKKIIKSQHNINIPDSAGDTALHIACNIGNKDAIEILIRAGAKTQTKNIMGKTPLGVAKRSIRNQLKALEKK